jgi:hypothetical protein
MSHPLDGARLKVVRAQKHLKALYHEIERYIDAEPYDVPVTQIGNLVSAEGVITAEPPPDLACIVGDCVTNLRAALDYVAWELVARFATKPLTGKQERRISFPIVANKSDFPKADAVKSLISVGGFRQLP